MTIFTEISGKILLKIGYFHRNGNDVILMTFFSLMDVNDKKRTLKFFKKYFFPSCVWFHPLGTRGLPRSPHGRKFWPFDHKKMSIVPEVGLPAYQGLRDSPINIISCAPTTWSLFSHYRVFELGSDPMPITNDFGFFFVLFTLTVVAVLDNLPTIKM